MNDFSGLAIIHNAQSARLKWHRLRRRQHDPLFSSAVLKEGLALGASMELDLRVRADGGFVVLHDDRLEGETAGSGLVSEASSADLRKLRMKVGGERLTLSEDLPDILSLAHPDALLQFDLKDGMTAIGKRGLDYLAANVKSFGKQVIVSAKDQDLILALRKRAPDLRRGIDPSVKLVDLMHSQGLAAVEAALVADVTGETDAETIYFAWPLVLDAARQGLDLIALCHFHGRIADVWTYNLQNPAAGFSESEWQTFSSLMALKPDQVTTDEALATERAWKARMTTVTSADAVDGSR